MGNHAAQTRTWDGRITQVQVFNRILSATEMDASLRAAGSVTESLRLWLPMTNGIDFHDRSGNDFHATATDITTGSSGPKLIIAADVSRGVGRMKTGYYAVNHHVIPRYGNGSTHPAGQLRGEGPASVVQGTTYGPESGAVDSQEIVVTEDYRLGVNYWANGNAASTTRCAPNADPRLYHCG